PRRPVERLLDDLKSPSALVREEAILALGEAGPAAAKAVPLLERLLGDEDGGTRARVAVALWRITGKAKLTAPALAEGLRAAPPPGPGAGAAPGRCATRPCAPSGRWGPRRPRACRPSSGRSAGTPASASRSAW